MRKMIVTLSAAAALIALGPAMAQASVRSFAPNATPACGAQCFDLSSLVLGADAIQNAYVPGDRGVSGRAGRPVNLKHASNARPNEDFAGAQVGTLGSFCGNLLSAQSYACVNYPAGYPVFESDWSPFGNQSGLCAGVARRGFDGERVTLQHCGATARTLWVGDLGHAVTASGHLYTPWVNGSDPNFSHPLVLTVNTGSFLPENQLKLKRLNLLTASTVADSQEFTLQPGPAA
jgi:hypothetical protein